jgi:hypothetical protein
VLVQGQSVLEAVLSHGYIEGHGAGEVDEGEGFFPFGGQEDVETPMDSAWQPTDSHELLRTMCEGRRDVAPHGQEGHRMRERCGAVRAEQGVNVTTLGSSASVRAHDRGRIGADALEQGFVLDHFGSRNLEQKLLVVPQADGLGGCQKFRIGGCCGSELGEAGQPCGREIFGLLRPDTIAVLEDRKALGTVDGLDLFGGGQRARFEDFVELLCETLTDARDGGQIVHVVDGGQAGDLLFDPSIGNGGPLCGLSTHFRLGLHCLKRTQNGRFVVHFECDKLDMRVWLAVWQQQTADAASQLGTSIFFPKKIVSRTFLLVVCYILPSQFAEVPIQTLPPVEATVCVDFLDRRIDLPPGRLDLCHEIVQRSALVEWLCQSNGLIGAARKSLGILSGRADRLVRVQIVEHRSAVLKDHVGRSGGSLTIFDHVDPRMPIVDLGELANRCSR